MERRHSAHPSSVLTGLSGSSPGGDMTIRQRASAEDDPELSGLLGQVLDRLRQTTPLAPTSS